MFYKPDIIQYNSNNVINNNNLEIDFSNVRMCGNNSVYVDIIDNKKIYKNIEIPIYNLLDIIKHCNINNGKCDDKFFIVKNNREYLINDKLDMYSDVMNDLELNNYYKRKTTKYKPGNIYVSKNTKYLYLGEFYYFSMDIFYNYYNDTGYEYNISLLIEQFNDTLFYDPIKRHILLDIKHYDYNDYLKLSDFINYMICNNRFFNRRLIFKKNLPVKTELNDLENDIIKNYGDEFFNKMIEIYDNNLLKNKLASNKININFNLDFLLISKDKNIDKNILINNVKNRLNIIKNILTNHKSLLYDGYNSVYLNNKLYYVIV